MKCQSAVADDDQAFFWAVLATLTLTWGYFRLPETKDRTFGEMDILVSYFATKTISHPGADLFLQFQKGVSARKTAKATVTEEDVNLTKHADTSEPVREKTSE